MSDVFVAGIFVGPLGGVYMSVTIPDSPINTSPPVVTGIPQSSNKLTCDPGTWDYADSFGYQWYKDGQPIIGQTRNQLTLNSTYIGSTILCIVTAANEFGSTSVPSNSTLIIP